MTAASAAQVLAPSLAAPIKVCLSSFAERVLKNGARADRLARQWTDLIAVSAALFATGGGESPVTKCVANEAVRCENRARQ